MIPILRWPTSRLLSVMTGASVALHVVFFIVAVSVGSCGTSKEYPDQAVIKTRLVKLGKKRDEKLLPRIDKAPPPPAPSTTKAPVPLPPEPPKPAKPEPKRETTPEPKRSAADVLKQFSADTPRDLSQLIEDKVGKPVDEGHEEGSAIGTEITGRLKAEYNDQIMAKIRDALAVPNTISEQERLRLKTRLGIAIDAEGTLVDATISKSSGHDAYDNAVLAAAKKAAPFPPPPIPVRAFYADGVAMNVCPVSCR